MEQAIKEIQDNIKFHKKSAGRQTLYMWLIVILALMAYILIESMMNQVIGNLVNAVNYAASNGIKNIATDPTKIALAGQDNRLGYLVLAMFTATLLAIFGKMRYHLKELALNEKRSFSLNAMRAASANNLDTDVKACILSNSFENSINEPIINLSTETISKLADTVISRTEGLLKNK